MMETIKVKSAIYPKEAVMKAAYHFIDQCYIHIDLSDEEYLISLTPKKSGLPQNLAGEFENELLAQTVRYQVYQQTHTLREVLMARAMSSTITGIDTALDSTDLPDQVDNLESILKDWFERNEE